MPSYTLGQRFPITPRTRPRNLCPAHARHVDGHCCGVPCHVFKSLQLTWTSGIRWWNYGHPIFKWIAVTSLRHREHQGNMPYFTNARQHCLFFASHTLLGTPLQHMAALQIVFFFITTVSRSHNLLNFHAIIIVNCIVYLTQTSKIYHVFMTASNQHISYDVDAKELCNPSTNASELRLMHWPNDIHICITLWRLWLQNQVSWPWMSNYFPQNAVGVIISMG